MDLGVHRPATDNICILAASGSVSFNGTKDENYGSKNRNVKIESGYHEFKTGETVAKSFVIRSTPRSRKAGDSGTLCGAAMCFCSRGLPRRSP